MVSCGGAASANAAAPGAATTADANADTTNCVQLVVPGDMGDGGGGGNVQVAGVRRKAGAAACCELAVMNWLVELRNRCGGKVTGEGSRRMVTVRGCFRTRRILIARRPGPVAAWYGADWGGRSPAACRRGAPLSFVVVSVAAAAADDDVCVTRGAVTWHWRRTGKWGRRIKHRTRTARSGSNCCSCALRRILVNGLQLRNTDSTWEGEHSEAADDDVAPRAPIDCVCGRFLAGLWLLIATAAANNNNRRSCNNL